MKKDKLEKFIVENRSAFDDLEPSKSVWENIELVEPAKKNSRWIKIFSQVAVAILLFIGAYFFHDLWQTDTTKYYAVAAKQADKIKSSDKLIVVLKQEEQVQQIKVFKKNNTTTPKKKVKTKKLNYENNELAEVKAYYSEIIKSKKAEVFYCTQNNPDVKNEINNEFGQLDKAFKELQNDLRENLDNSQVVDAMIQNYRMKLEVLEYMKNHVCTADLK